MWCQHQHAMSEVLSAVHQVAQLHVATTRSAAHCDLGQRCGALFSRGQGSGVDENVCMMSAS